MAKKSRKILLTAFHWGVPGVPDNTPIQLKVYPNYVAEQDSLNLDPAAILIGTSAVYDRTAMDYVHDQRFLRQMSARMRELHNAGRLELVSYSDHIREFASELQDWLDKELANEPEKWRHQIMAQLAQQQLLTREQAPIIGRTLNAAYEALPSGVMAHLALIGDKIDLVEAQRIMKLLKSRRRRFTAGEAAVLREVTRPYLAQAGSDILLSNRLGVTLTPWFDLRAFYAAMADSEHSPLSDAGLDRRLNEECTRLFKEVAPYWRPETAKEIIKFQKDRKARESLLVALRDSVVGTKPLTAEQISRDLRAMIYRHERAEHIEGGIKVASVGAKVALGAVSYGVLPAAGELVGETVLKLTEQGVEAITLGSEEAVSRRGRKAHAWMSLLINMEFKRARRVERTSARIRLGDRVRSLLRLKRAA